MKILNLYSGIGGNRKLWNGVKVTAIEINPVIAKIYQGFFPNDIVIVEDAHKYLLNHYKDNWDFIWSSPPCPSHSHIRKELAVEARQQNEAIYPDMKLYEEIIFLQHFFKKKWVVENVISYYEPLIKPWVSGHHYFWSNFPISDFNSHSFRCHHGKLKDLYKLKGFDLSNMNNIDKRAIIRNCVKPELGKHIFNCAFKLKQKKIDLMKG